MTLKEEDQATERVELISAEPLSTHERAIYEAGISLFKDSLAAGKEFCKLMIPASFGAIPIYIAVLNTTSVPGGKVTIAHAKYLAALPGLLFMASALIFIVGYFPQTHTVALDVVEEVERAIRDAIHRRQRLVVVGLLLFMAGAVAASVIVLQAGWGDLQTTLRT